MVVVALRNHLAAAHTAREEDLARTAADRRHIAEGAAHRTVREAGRAHTAAVEADTLPAGHTGQATGLVRTAEVAVLRSLAAGRIHRLEGLVALVPRSYPSSRLWYRSWGQ